MFFKYDCTLIIGTDNTIVIQFDDTSYLKFIGEYFDNTIVQQGLMNKKKFHFTKVSNIHQIENLKQLSNINGIYFPSFLEKVQIRQNVLNISMSNLTEQKNNYNVNLSRKIITKMRLPFELIQFQKNGSVEGYIPIRSNFKVNEVTDTVCLQLLVKINFSHDETTIFTDELIQLSCTLEFDENTLHFISRLDIYQKTSNLVKYLNNYLPSNGKNLLTYLFKISNLEYNKNQKRAYLRHCITHNQSDILSVALNKNMILEMKHIYQTSGLNDEKLLKDIISAATMGTDDLLIYLNNVGYSNKQIFENSNMFDWYYEKMLNHKIIKGNSGISIQIREYQNILDQLKHLIYLENETYTINDATDKSLYVELFKRVNNLHSELLKYKIYAKENMNRFINYFNVFIKAKNEITELNVIENNPHKLTKKISKKLLNTGNSYARNSII